MLLYALSMMLYLGVTAYCIYFTYKRKDRITCMTGMMIAMTVGMMLSTAAGVIFGIVLERDIVLSTIASMTVGMAAGYMCGRPVSLMAAMDGLMAGIMGGMMGAMLGVMMQPNNTSIMIMFMDVVFMIIMFLLINMIEEETGLAKDKKKKEENPAIPKKPFFLLSIVVILGIVALLTGVLGTGMLATGNGKSVKATLNGDVQEATVSVGQEGYNPDTLELQAGVPGKITFKADSFLGCLRTVVFKDFGITERLELNSGTVIDLPAMEPGNYDYSCGMGMYVGQIIVK